MKHTVCKIIIFIQSTSQIQYDNNVYSSLILVYIQHILYICVGRSEEAYGIIIRLKTRKR